jgi:hypothetical protein
MRWRARRGGVRAGHRGRADALNRLIRGQQLASWSRPVPVARAPRSR